MVLLATGPDLETADPGGRPAWRDDPAIRGRLIKLQHMLDAEMPQDRICEELEIDARTIRRDRERLRDLAQDDFLQAQRDYFAFIIGGDLRDLQRCARAFEEAPVDSSLRAQSIDKALKIRIHLTALLRLGQPLANENPSEAEQEVLHPAGDVTLTETRSLQIGGLEFQRLMAAEMAAIEARMPHTTIEQFRSELGGDNIKPVGEVLDVEFDPDAQDGDDEL